MKSRRISKRERELLTELHYWQMRVRIDIRSLKRSIAKTKEIAAQLSRDPARAKRGTGRAAKKRTAGQGEGGTQSSGKETIP